MSWWAWRSCRPWPCVDGQQIFRSGVSLVLVDLRVIDKNYQSVADLTADDVEVLVDGQLRAFEGFEYHGDAPSLVSHATSASAHDQSPHPAERTEARSNGGIVSRPQGRIIIFAVQSNFIDLGDGPRTYKGAEAFIDHLSATDKVAVIMLPAGADKHLVFTSHHDALKIRLKDALLHTSGNEWRRAAGPANCDAPPTAGGSFRVSRGCRDAAVGPAAEIEEIQRVRNMTGDLNALFLSLAAIEGPKDVVLVTTDIDIPLGEIALLAEMVGVASGARVRVHALQVGNVTDWVSPESRISRRPEEISIPTTTSRMPISSSMLHLATATGGVAMTPMTGTVFFDRLERELAGSYVLAFEPLPSERDGKPHKIQVHLRKRSRLTVRARESFVLRKEPSAPAPASADPPPATVP